MKGGIRTGCWCCPMAIKYEKLSHLRYYYPKLFDFLVVKKGLGERMVDMRLRNLKGLATRKKDYLLNLIVKREKKFAEILKHRPRTHSALSSLAPFGQSLSVRPKPVKGISWLLMRASLATL